MRPLPERGCVGGRGRGRDCGHGLDCGCESGLDFGCMCVAVTVDALQQMEIIEEYELEISKSI